MSYKLLEALNGQNDGHFKRWLSQWGGITPRIAWYPSAGFDFKALVKLRTETAEKTQRWLNQQKQHKDIDLPAHDRFHPREPEFYKHHLFLFTDYLNCGNTQTFEPDEVIYDRNETSVTVLRSERLPDCQLPVRSELVSFPEPHRNSHQVYFMELELRVPRRREPYQIPLLYLYVENTAFCAKMLVKHEAKLSHIIHIRHGGGLGGGGRSRGKWLQQTLEQFEVEFYIVDNSGLGEHARHLHIGGHDEMSSLSQNLFPELSLFTRQNNRHIHEHAYYTCEWSDYGLARFFWINH